MEVGLVAQRGNERAAGIVGELRDRLRDRGVGVLVDAATATELEVEGVPVDRMSDADLVASIGGDGTFLFAARGAGTTPMVGVNLGEVGFLNAIAPEDAVEEVLAAVEAERAGDLSIREVPRLAATGDDWSLEPAINEVLVQGPRRGSGIEATVEIRVDGSTYVREAADGVIVATPTGSTAYNLSEGGPLIHPGAHAAVITAMVPREGVRPLVIDADATVGLRIEDVEEANVVSDGRVTRTVDPPAEVEIQISDRPLRLAGPDIDYFRALEKLE